jgi:hypothetical protein
LVKHVACVILCPWTSLRDDANETSKPKNVILYKRKKVVILKCFFCTTLAATNSHACVHLLFDFHAAAQPRLPAVAAAKGSRWKLAVKHRLLWCKRTGAAEVSP